MTVFAFLLISGLSSTQAEVPSNTLPEIKPAESDFLSSDSAKQQALPEIIIDGFFEDWDDVPVGVTESSNDAPGAGVNDGDGIFSTDFASVKVIDTPEMIYFLLDVTGEVLNQTTDNRDPRNSSINYGSDIRLLIDSDSNASTGISFEDLGVEMLIEFGQRELTLYDSFGNPTSSSTTEQGIVTLPTYSSNKFEISIPKSSLTSGVQNNSFRFVLKAEITEDRLPDTGFINYNFQNLNLPQPPDIPLEKHPDADFRVLVHNVLNTTPAFNPDPYIRILEATQPDIICWQEVRDSTWNDAQVVNFFNANYPNPYGGSWRLARRSDTVTLSPWQIFTSAGISGNHIAYINLPDEFGDGDLVIFNVHTPCCDNESGRDFEHDEVSFNWQSLLNGVGAFNIDPINDMVLMTGDFNMVGIQRQLITLRDGDYIGNFPSYNPGRSEGSLIAVESRHTHSNQTWTWYNPDGSFAPGRLDWSFYSGDVAELVRTYALFANDLPAEVLQSSGLQGNETPEDHLPLVLDFRMKREETVSGNIFIYQ